MWTVIEFGEHGFEEMNEFHTYDEAENHYSQRYEYCRLENKPYKILLVEVKRSDELN